MVVQGPGLVQNKMADCNGGATGDERRSIVGNKHKKYGSTSSLMHRNEIVKHVVQPGETLQGIALRYRVTTEQIRRANRIWTNDSLFLRATLDVPVPRQSADKLSWDDDLDDVQEEMPSTSAASPHPFFYEPSGAVRANGDSNRAGPSRRDSEGSENCDQPLISAARADAGPSLLGHSTEPTFNDIFLRIDSSIAESRTQADRRERLHELFDGSPESPPETGAIRRTTAHRARMRHSLEQQKRDREMSEELTPRVTVHPVTVTQGRKVQSSLQRIQRQQDEIFEL